MTRIMIAITGLTLALQASPADAQDRWALELRASGALATQDVERENHQNGFGFEGTVRYRFMPHLAVYAGWDWTHFTAGESFAGPDMGLEETGYAFGLRFEHPISGGSRTAGWARVGGTYNHLELEDADGEIVSDSGHGLGWEAGAGIAVPFGGRWSLTPGIRYRSLSRDLEIGGTTNPVDLQYVAFELGIARHF